MVAKPMDMETKPNKVIINHRESYTILHESYTNMIQTSLLYHWIVSHDYLVYQEKEPKNIDATMLPKCDSKVAQKAKTNDEKQ